MRRLLIAVVCLFCVAPVFAQGADEAPTKDEIILYLRTMRSHDMLQKTMEVQAQSMQQLYRDMLLKEKGKLPDNFDMVFKKAMDDLIKGMPTDEIVQAMIPAYQKHFTRSDIEAMSAFYSSPVGQKALQELPAVLQEGNQAAMPILSKYLGEWQERMKHEFEQLKTGTPRKGSKGNPIEN